MPGPYVTYSSQKQTGFGHHDPEVASGTLSPDLLSNPCMPSEEFMVGDSAVMKEVFDKIRRQAPTTVPILITGESGTGKELAARAIHQRSAVSNGRFVAINCASLPSSLIASELFGYEKGAFTGANARKIGLIELANNGTLFLDEIGDLPLESQGHLLRFLQEGTIVRVGGHTPIHVNARIISATHVDLRRAIVSGRFRDDLYYRLNVLPLHLPSLRERDGDLKLLARYFLDKLGRELGRQDSWFTPEAEEAIETYPWPGNIREMISAIRRALVMGKSKIITVSDLALEVRNPPVVEAAHMQPAKANRCRPGSCEEKTKLMEALARHAGNVSQTARDLDVSRVTIYKMIKRHGLNHGTPPV